MAKLNSGDQAPTFKLSDQNEKEVKLEDYKGKKVLVYFYPKADTPGCTKQACNVRDARAELADLGVDVIGISPDAPGKQKKFGPSQRSRRPRFLYCSMAFSLM